MVLPYTIMCGNVMTVWVLILLSTYRYISGQGGIVDTALRYYLYLCAKLEGKYVLPTASTGFARCCRQAPGARMQGDEATADDIVVWCWCCCGLWLHARTHYPPLGFQRYCIAVPTGDATSIGVK